LLAAFTVGAALAPDEEEAEPEVVASAATTASEVEKVKTVTDVEGNTCDGGETKYGRCPSSPDYGKTMAEARKAKAARAKAKAAREAAEREERELEAREAAEAAAEAERLANAWKQGYDEVQDGIAIRWDNSVCTSSYYSCFGL
jgi:hypothetical protein